MIEYMFSSLILQLTYEISKYSIVEMSKYAVSLLNNFDHFFCTFVCPIDIGNSICFKEQILSNSLKKSEYLIRTR